MTETSPDAVNAGTLFDQALSAHRQGQLDRAQSLYQDVLERDPRHGDALSLLGAIALQRNDPSTALRLIDRSLICNPTNAAAYSNRGIALAALGRLDEALASYEQAIGIQPNYPEAMDNRGLALAGLGRLDEAVASHQQALRLKPDYIEAWNNQGDALQKLGRFEDALACFQRAIDITPEYAQGWNNRGNALIRLGRLADALDSYDRAIEIRPDYVGPHYNSGLVLQALRRHIEALDRYDRAISLMPGNADAHNGRAVILNLLERYDEALASCDRALALDPSHADAHTNRGFALQHVGRPDDALASYDTAITLKPDATEAWNNRGKVLLDLGRTGDALASFGRAVEAGPSNGVAHTNRGLVLYGLGRLDEALANLDRAVEVAPDFADAHNGRGLVLGDMRRLNEGLESCEKALAINPNMVDAWNNRGNILRELGQLATARDSYMQAMAINSDHPAVRQNLSLLDLLTGDFAAGWQGYEWRWHDNKMNRDRRAFTQPKWLGREALGGKTILLHSEQGLGDTLHFCRYAKLVENLGATVILEVQGSLTPLLESLEGVSRIVARGAALPELDFVCPLLSLPLAFATDLKTIPAEIQYLEADPGKVAEWTERLGARKGPRVGLAWSGSPTHTKDLARSIPLERFVERLPDGFQYISLQKDVRPQDHAVLADRPEIAHFGDALEDFGDTAALCASMDIVISVDTSTAHLAGALGRPVFVLLPYIPDWRWLLDRDDSPWYPSATLFRQKEVGNWTDVLDRVGDALRAQLAIESKT